MTYCDYAAYQTNGGKMSPDDFYVWSIRASRKIDRLTGGKAGRYARECAAELSDACGQIADVLSAYSLRTAESIGLSSATNDGGSESYADPTQSAKGVDQACFGILADALGADRYGLLYAGVYPC